MSRRLIALVLGSALAGGCSESAVGPSEPEVTPSLSVAAVPPYLPGEQQPRVDPSAGPHAIYPEFAGQNLSQTFTPATNQYLGFLKLPVACAAGVLLNVKIRDGLGGPILYQSNHSRLPTGSPGSFQKLQVFNSAVSNGIKLRAGRIYAFELASFPGSGATASTCSLLRAPAGDPYRRGRGYYRMPVNGTLWLRLPNGAPTDEGDLPFITLVQ